MTWRDKIKVHPAADLLPMMTEAELLDLAKDIYKNGMLHLPLVWQDDAGAEWLIDGRNRLDALELLQRMGGVEMFDETGRLKDTLFQRISRQTGDYDPYVHIISLNIKRRHLTGEQKRDVITKLLKAKPEMSNRSIAKAIGRDDKTVAKVRADLEAGAEIPHVTKTTGADGKSYSKKASKPKATATTTTESAELRRQAEDAGEKASRARSAADAFDKIGRESNEELFAPEAELLEQLEFVVGKYMVGTPGDAWISAAKVLNKLYSKVTSRELTAETHRDRWPGFGDGKEIQYEIEAAVTPPDGGAA